MSRLKRFVLIAVAAAALIVGSAAPALAGKGGVPNEKSCGGIGRQAQTFAGMPGPMDPEALFNSLPPFTCDDVGEEHGQGF
jgi:hypothetical protein